MISFRVLPSAWRFWTYSMVVWSYLMRVVAIRQRAWLAWRFPPRLRRCRTVCPEEACTGLAPHRAANVASERMRWGLSPAAVNRVAAVSVPIPRAASSAGLTWAQRRWISVSNSLISAVSAWYRRANTRRACLAYLMVVGVVPGRKAAQTLTRAWGG